MPSQKHFGVLYTRQNKQPKFVSLSLKIIIGAVNQAALVFTLASSRTWPTPAYSDSEFLERRTTVSRPKAELLEPLISVLRMHPNGQPQNSLNRGSVCSRQNARAIPFTKYSPDSGNLSMGR